MNREQLDQIKEIYDMMNRGLTNPIKINNAYKLINPNFTSDPPTRAKINGINRFMMLNYRDEYDAMRAKEEYELKTDIVKIDLPEDYSIGTIDNKPFQSHSEEINENRSFLTAEQKQELIDPPKTKLEVPKRKRSPNGTKKGK